MSDVVIVGAGLAGLCCALRLQEAGVDYQLVEASDKVGGRVRTDSERGFIFDRGFQVLLTSYPEAVRVLDFSSLDLHHFESGCAIFRDGEFQRVMDPWRHPGQAVKSLSGTVGSFGDKLRLARLRTRVTIPSLDSLLERREVSTREAIDREGFGDEIRESFFQPFLGGIFLDPDLRTSSRKFHWVFRMFAKGRAAVPAGGMGMIPAQMLEKLPAQRVLLNTPVARITEGRVSLQDGRDLLCAQTVVATDPGTAAKLIDGLPKPRFRSVCNLHYSMDEAPLRGPMLILNGEGRGPVNNMSFMSEVTPLYAPAKKALASVTVLGNPVADDRALDGAVREQLIEWYGMIVGEWKLEKVYRINEALPDQPAGSLRHIKRAARIQNWLVVAGDWRNIASINGAMESGRLAAEAVLEKVLD
jgi:phytoene dehydrogenase-like protein